MYRVCTLKLVRPDLEWIKLVIQIGVENQKRTTQEGQMVDFQCVISAFDGVSFDTRNQDACLY
jgi:hypothetical protein